MLLKTLLTEAEANPKMELLLKHEAAAGEEDYYTNSEEMPKKAAAAANRQRELEAKAEKTFGKDFATDMMQHTNARLEAIHSGKPSFEGAEAAKIREKHGIDHAAYSARVDVPVHPKLLQRKDVVDPKVVKNIRKILPRLQEMDRTIDMLTSKRSTKSEVDRARRDVAKLRDELVAALNNLPLDRA